MGQSVDFIRSVKAELKKVTWPTRDELSKATRMILILAVVLGLAIGWMDLLFNWILVTGVARLGR
jgi:preprotein translocase subunit SecE